MKSVRNAKISYIIYSIVLMITGIILIIYPDISASAMSVTIGIVITVCGVVKFIDYFVNDSYGLAFQFDFALGLFTIVIGLVVLFHPQKILEFINIILGIFVFIDGTFKLQTAKESKQFGIKNWWLILILAIITSLFGLILIFNPFSGAIALMIIIGVSLVIVGIQNLCIALYTIRLVKRFGPRNK